MNKKILYTIFFLLGLGGGLIYTRLSKGVISYRPVHQPVAYSHKIHVHIKRKLACKACHQGVETKYHATLPGLKVCTSCHVEPQGKTEMEKRLIKQYIEPEKPISWKRLFVLPDHVFFSHRLHVVRARIECQTCHGPMDMQRRPPTRPLRVLTMNDCRRCHRKRNVSTDCNTCHH